MLQLISVSVLAASVALVLGLYKFLVYPILISPLSKIPAVNFSAHISPVWLYYTRYTGQENRAVCDLHTKKGPILRLAPNELSINCYEEGLKTIYAGGFLKDGFYVRRFTNYGMRPMLAMIDNREHSIRKRMLSQIYSKSYILSSSTVAETTRATLFDRLLPIIQASSESNQPVEVLSLNHGYSMNTFMSFQFGLKIAPNLVQNVSERSCDRLSKGVSVYQRPYGTPAPDRVVSCAQKSEDILTFARYLHNYSSPRPWFFWIDSMPRVEHWLRTIGIRLIPAHCDQAAEELRAWLLKFCDSAEQLLTENSDPSPRDRPIVFAHQRAHMRKAAAADSEKPYPFRLDLATEMYDHMVAAHETSGPTLTWLLYELSLRPAVQACLRRELLTLDPPLIFPRPSDASDALPDPKAVDALPLLDAILQETLRLWPAVPGGQPRVTPAGGCSLAGYDNIPAGVRVQSSAYSLHRNPDVFPEPEEWRPKRWLDADAAQLAEMRRWFWAWSSGGRMCIGSNFATHSMKHAVAALYTNFTSHVVDAEGIEQTDGYTASPKGNKLVLQWRHV